jgi:tetratricopeptide (TPR) repeat protein
MARRRINTRFLGVLISVMVVLAIGAVMARKFLHKENPQPYIAAGDAAMKAEDWNSATADFGKAASLLPKDPRLLWEYGHALAQTAPDDPDVMRKAVGAWRGAVEIDPNFKEAWLDLLRLYDSQLTHMEAAQGERNREQLAGLYSDERDTVAQLIRVDPKNPYVVSLLPSLNVRMWLMDVPIPLTADEQAMPYDKRPTDEQKVNTAVVQLLQNLHDDPTNVPAGVWIAEARIHQAQIALAKDRNADVGQLFAQAAGVYDEAIKSHPANLTQLYIAQTEVMSLLLRADPRPDFHKTYTDRFRQTLDQAQAAVDPAKNLQEYEGVKMRWARVLSLTDPAGAEKVYRDILSHSPDEIPPKTELARMLDRDSARRQDALEVLNKVPQLPPADVSAARRSMMMLQIADSQLVRAEILINQFVGASDPVLRSKLNAQIQTVLDQLGAQYADSWMYLKLKGKFQLAQGPSGYRDAIQTLQNADEQMNRQTSAKDTELLMLEADAYQHGDQSSKAISVLEQAMHDQNVANTPIAHLTLATLYLNEQSPERAKPHLEWLAVRFPNDPDVIKLQIRGLDSVTDHDAVIALYDKLPETSKALIQDKAVVAHRIGNDADALRLLQGLHTTDLSDVSVAYSLGVLQLQMGKKDDATKTLQESLKAKPNDTMLVLLQQAINGDSKEALSKSAEFRIREGFTDPYTREMRLADLAVANGNHDDEMSHLKAALAVRANDGPAMDRLFRRYLSAGQYDLATPFLEPLAKLDYDSAHGLLYKFRFALTKGDSTTALAVGQQLVTDFPEFSESWESMGDALQAAGQYDDASSKYLQALDRQATNVQALRGLIACSYQLNKLDDAKRYIEDARQKYPNDPAYRDMEVQHELRYGDPETVLPSLLDAVKQHPDDPRNYQLAATSLLRAAQVKSNKGDPDTAKAHISQARDVLQQAVGRWPDEMAFTSALCEACVDAGDVAAAEAAVKALADRPKWKDQPSPSVLLAQVYIQSGKTALAEAPLRDALSKAKNSPDLQLRLAGVLVTQRKYDQALAVLQDNKALPAIIKARAEVLLDLNRGADAEAEVAPAEKAAPNDAALADLLTFIYYREGKLNLAHTCAEQSISAFPDDLRAHYLRAIVSMHDANADPDAAIADLKFVLDHDANDVEARVALADTYVLKHDPEEGISNLETALAAAPLNKVVRLKLVDMYNLTTPPRYGDAVQVLNDGLALPQFKNDVDFLRDSAIIYSRAGDSDKAIASMRTAMSLVKDKSLLIHDYLIILLASHNDSLLLSESDSLLSDPKVPWWIYDLRGQAKADAKDPSADKEFDMALTQALAQDGRVAAAGVAGDIQRALGSDEAIALVGPKAQNSASWKLILIPLYEGKQDHADSIATAESAMKDISTLSPAEQDQLLAYTASLYVTATPPMTDKAMGIFQEILKRRPNDFMSMNNIACMYADNAVPPQPEKALEYSQRAFDLVQKTGRVEPMIYDTQGWALILNDRVDDGIDILQKVAEGADFPDVHYHLAEGYLKKGLPDGALRELKAASTIMDKAVAAKRDIDVVLRNKIDLATKEANLKLSAKSEVPTGELAR